MEKHQLETAFRVSHLIFLCLSAKISAEEQAELNVWLEKNENNQLLLDILKDAEQFNQLLNQFYKTEARKKAVRKKLSRSLFTYKTKIIHFTARVWKYVA